MVLTETERQTAEYPYTCQATRSRFEFCTKAQSRSFNVVIFIYLFIIFFPFFLLKGYTC